MADVYAVQDGPWSDTATWNTTSLPDISDDVFPNGYTVSLDVPIVVNRLSNQGAGPIESGGIFTIAEDISLSVEDFASVNTGPTGMIHILADCTIYITGELHSGIANGTVIFIADPAVEEVTINVDSIRTRYSGGYAIFHAAGILNLNVASDISGSTGIDAGTSEGIAVQSGATLNLTVTGGMTADGGDLVIAEGGTVNATVSGTITADVGNAFRLSSGILELNAQQIIAGEGTAVEADTGDLTIQAVSILGGSGEEAVGLIVQEPVTAVVTLSGVVEGGTGEQALGIQMFGDLALETGMVKGGAALNAHGILVHGDSTLTLEATNVTGGSAPGVCGVFVHYGDLDVTTTDVSGTEYFAACGIRSTDINARARTVRTSTGVAQNGAPAVFMLEPDDKVIYEESATASPDGTVAFLVPIIQTLPASEVSMTIGLTGGGSTLLSNTNAVSLSLPGDQDVRQGVVFGNGTHTGTLAVPNPKQVSFGVPTDNTTGTAALMLPQVVNYFGEQIRAAFNLESGIVFIEPTVYHGSNANHNRPNNPGPVIWVGSVEPNNAIDGDVWVSE